MNPKRPGDGTTKWDASSISGAVKTAPDDTRSPSGSGGSDGGGRSPSGSGGSDGGGRSPSGSGGSDGGGRSPSGSGGSDGGGRAGLVTPVKRPPTSRALLVGINAYPKMPLRGCVNDVNEMAELLVDSFGFDDNQIRLVVDERATTTALLERLEWLVSGLQAGDRAYFHFSGHGALFPIRDREGAVVRVDECICPVDFDWSIEKAIRDKQFYEIFSSVPAGVEFVWVSDSCYSGDLARSPERGASKLGAARTMQMPVDIAWRLRTANSQGLSELGFSHVLRGFHVALVAACGKNETCREKVIEDPAGGANDVHYGAFSYYLREVLTQKNGKELKLSAVVKSVAEELHKNEFVQHPHTEGSEAIKSVPFLLPPATNVQPPAKPPTSSPVTPLTPAGGD